MSLVSLSQQGMNLPVATGEKYALITLDSVTAIDEPVELHDGFFALPHGSVTGDSLSDLTT